MSEYVFNANEVEDDGGGDFSVLPKGDYAVIATDSEIKTTKTGNGKYISYELEVIEGQLAGRKLWLNINIENPNQQAVDIGRREYKRMHDAIGIASSTRTEDLHDKPFIARVDIDKNNQDRNVIKGFKPYGKQAPAASAPVAPKPVAQHAPSAPPASSVPPWKR